MAASKSAVFRHRSLSTPNRSDRKSTRLNSSHSQISYAVFCLKKKKKKVSRKRSIGATNYYFGSLVLSVYDSHFEAPPPSETETISSFDTSGDVSCCGQYTEK